MAVVRDAFGKEQLLKPLLVVKRRLHPEIRGSRQDALREGQDALDIEFVDRLGVVVDLREREFLAQLVALPGVRGQVDGLGVQERLVKPVELLAHALHMAFDVGGPLSRLGAPLFPGVQDAILDQPHVPGRRLQQREFVDEGALEDGLADAAGATTARAVVVRVAAAASA